MLQDVSIDFVIQISSSLLGVEKLKFYDTVFPRII